MLFVDDGAVFRAFPGEAEPPREISEPPAPDARVTSMTPSPDGRWVVYSGFGLTWGSGLFVVSTDGRSDPIKISGESVPGRGPLGGVFAGPRWNPASTMVLFQADFEVDRIYELYTSTRDGAQVNQKVNGPLSSNADVERWFSWSPDGTRVMYMANQVAEGRFGIYTSKPDGTDNQNVTSAEGILVFSTSWHPNSTRVAYIAAPDAQYVGELYTQKPDGSDLQKVSRPVTQFGDVGGYAWNRDGEWIAYWGDLEVSDRRELYVARPDGSDNKKVSRDIVSGLVLSPTWNPQGTRVGYLNRLSQNAPYELFTNSLDGTDNQRVHSALGPDGFVSPAYQWSPDGGRIAYMAGQTNQWANLYTSTPTGSERKTVALDNYLGPNSGVIRWSPTGSLLAHFSDEGPAHGIAIRTVAPDGTDSKVVSLPLEEGEILERNFLWSPDGEWIAYLTELNGGFNHALYVASADGTSARNVRADVGQYFELDSPIYGVFSWVRLLQD